MFIGIYSSMLRCWLFVMFGGQLICTSLSLLFLVFPHVYVVLFGKLFGSKSHQIVISYYAFLAFAKEDRKRRGFGGGEVGRGVLDYTCTMASDGLKVENSSEVPCPTFGLTMKKTVCCCNLFSFCLSFVVFVCFVGVKASD